MSPKLINIITNVIGGLLVVLEPVRSYLLSQPFDWVTFGICVAGAIIGYFTGKSALFTPTPTE